MNAPNELTVPVARASVPSNMSNAPPTKTTIAPMVHSWAASSAAPRIEIPKPMSVSPFGVRPTRPIASAIGSKTFLIWPRDSFEIVMSACHSQYCALPLGEFVECLRPEAADGFAAMSPCLDDASAAEAADVPGHERLRQSDMRDELRDRRLAVRQAAHDPKAIHVGHDLVEGTQLAEVIRLGDGRGDGAANSGGRRGQGCDSSWGWCRT